MEEKRCSKCKVLKDVGEFHKSRIGKYGVHSWCKACVAVYSLAYYTVCYQGTGPKGLITRMKYLFESQCRVAENYAPPDTTPEEMVKMWEDQKGRCAITGRPITLFNCHISHDHDTGKVHGFVLNHVNTLEGHIKDLTREEILVIYDFYRPAPKPTSPQPI